MNFNIRQSLSVNLCIATGAFALLFAPVASQAQNTVTGTNALHSDTTGSYNTADGFATLYANTTGFDNSAVGFEALYANTTGNSNTAEGFYSLYANTTGTNNTANGAYSLSKNTTGYCNTANGSNTLVLNTKGTYNTANGMFSLYSNNTGVSNTGNGYQSLVENTTGNSNTAEGAQALFYNTTGSNNIALGYYAGYNLTTGSNNIIVGNQGLSSDSGVIRIGTKGSQTVTYIAGISGVSASGGVAVYINSNGQLGTITSSRRFKKDIHTMGSSSDKLMQLRPVTFRYKQAAEDGSHPLQYGLIAEEVAKVYPDLVQYDKQGKPFTVFYHLLTPMILSELQKEHRQNVAMNLAHKADRAEIAVLKSALQMQSARLTSLQQLQQQQTKMLAKLAAFVQTSQNKEAVQKAVFVQH